MSIFDIVIVGIIICFGLFGMWFGIISAAGSLVGSAAGVFISSRIYEYPANVLVRVTGWSGNFPKVVMFVVVFLIVNRLVGLAFQLLDKLLYVFTSLPIISSLNRILGTIFGVFEGILVVGIFFYFVDRNPLPWQNFMTLATNSKVVTICEGIASFLWPLLPDVLRYL
jgi:uncharacterized membrane protein required for colicin V production